MTFEQTGNTSLIERFYAQLDEDDWHSGADLYQLGQVVEVRSFQQLMTAQVVEQGRKNEVRLKLHPSGKMVQWIECTCRKNRRHSLHCQHIAALIIYIDRERQDFCANLDLKTPAKNTSTPKTTPSQASDALFQKLKDNIKNVTANKGGEPGFKVKIELKSGQYTNYILDVDASAQFLADNQDKFILSKELQSLKTYKATAKIGTRIYSVGSEKVQAERSIAIRLQYSPFANSDKYPARTKVDRHLEIVGGSRPSKEVSFLIFPFKHYQKFLGEEFFYLPKFGFWKLDLRYLKDSWHELPMSKTYVDDEAAKFFGSSFAEFQEHGPIWLSHELKGSKVENLKDLRSIKVHASGDGWFYLDPCYGVGGSSNEQQSLIPLIKAAQKNKRRFIKDQDKWLEIPEIASQFDWNIDPGSQLVKMDTLGLIRLQAGMDGKAQIHARKQLLEDIKNKIAYDESLPVPKLKSEKLKLRPYQEKGYRWLWWLYKNRLHGLLADDMGLGKTHQAMALMSAIQQERQQEKPYKFLVIAPTTVLEHWADKIDDFAPELRAMRHHGAQRDRQYTEIKEKYDTLITSYGVLLRDIDKLSEISWELVVLDEAHYVKNQNTATFKAACRLKSVIRICLTGTPMENHLSELKNLFNFLVPGYLGSEKYFQKKFITPIVKQKSEKQQRALQRLLHPLKLRRTKAQVLTDLPPKIEDIRHCKLSPEQVTLYRETLALKGKPLVEQLHTQKNIPYMHVFSLLQLLKQICDHPALLEEGSDYRNHESGKFEALKEIIAEAIGSNEKVVIFSQYIRMLEIIKSYADEQGIKNVILTGASSNRGKIIKQFQTDPETKLFIGSLLAGGIGIDLTAASVVIHYDRWWNASKENQATDRVHRIGQDNYVQVLKLVTRGTLEEKIQEMITKKQEIFHLFMDRDEELFRSISRSDLINLLS